MNTPAHLIFAAAAFARPERPGTATAALIGGFLPDASLYLMVGWERWVNGRAPRQIFREDYFSDYWQTVFSIDNSFFLWALLLAAALWTGLLWLQAFAGAGLLHIALDLPLHVDDGRAHFQPLTDWVFQSPISYWDPSHHGNVVGAVELLFCIALTVLLIRRYQGWRARTGILALLGMEFAAGGVWVLFF